MIKAHFKTYLLFKGKKMTKETFKVAGMTTNNGNNLECILYLFKIL